MIRNRQRTSGLRRPARDLLGRGASGLLPPETAPWFTSGVKATTLAPRNPLANLWNLKDADPTDQRIIDGGQTRTCRIPVGIRLSTGVGVVIQELHETGTSDFHVSELTLKTSTDADGEVWSAPKKVVRDADYSAGVHWIFNPVLAEIARGEVLLFYCMRAGATGGDGGTNSLFVRQLTFSGEAFSVGSATDLSALIPDPNSWFATGPGGAIIKQYAPQKGRLLVPMDFRLNGNNPNASNPSFSGTLTLDDLTAWSDVNAWSVSHVDTSKSGNEQSNELWIVEIQAGEHKGKLYGECRMVGGVSSVENYRGQIISSDGGDSWSDVTLCDGGSGRPNLPANSCHGAGLALPDGRILAVQTVDAGARARLEARISADFGATWTSRTLSYKHTGYAELIPLARNGRYLTVFEHCDQSGTGDWYTGGFAAARFNLAWLLDSSDATRPQCYFPFTEATSGPVLALYDHGRLGNGMHWDVRGYGGTNVVHGLDGLEFQGSGTPTVLSEVHTNGRLGGFFDPGLGSLTIEAIVTWGTNASAATRILWDNRDNTGIGMTFSLNPVQRPTFAISDGAGNNASRTGSSGTYNDTTKRAYRCVYDAITRQAKLYVDGVELTGGANATLTAIPILGSKNFALGRRSTDNTTPNHAASGCKLHALRVTRGIVPDDQVLTVANYTRPSTAALLGLTPVASYGLPDLSHTKLLLGSLLPVYPSPVSASNYDGDPLAYPVQPGTGIARGRNTLGSDVFSLMGSVFRSQTVLPSSGFGRYWRMTYGGSTSGAFQTSATRLLDFVQNAAAFTVVMLVRIEAGTGSQVLLSNLASTSATAAGFFFQRNSTGTKLSAKIGVGSDTWRINENPISGSAAFTAGNDYALVFRANGSGKLEVRYATVTGGVVGSWSSFQTDNSIAQSNGQYDSAAALCIGSIAGDSGGLNGGFRLAAASDQAESNGFIDALVAAELAA